MKIKVASQWYSTENPVKLSFFTRKPVDFVGIPVEQKIIFPLEVESQWISTGIATRVFHWGDPHFFSKTFPKNMDPSYKRVPDLWD